MHDIPPAPSLIDYPCDFPIKVMGLNQDGFVLAMTRVVSGFDPGFDPKSVEVRPSRGAKYLGLTLTVNATSREQLDEIYRTLSAHPLVKIVL